MSRYIKYNIRLYIKEYIYINLSKKKQGKVNNKRWSDLKSKQQEFIIVTFNEEYKNILLENKKIPSKNEKLSIINKVYNLVLEIRINIGFNEVSKKCSSKMHKLNLKYL